MHGMLIVEYQPNGQAHVSLARKKIERQTLWANGKDLVEFSTPQDLTIDEIPQIFDQFHIAARNVRAAGGLLLNNSWIQ